MVLADVPGAAGAVLPVRVYAAGPDSQPPVVDSSTINGGAPSTSSLNVAVSVSAHDVGGAGITEFRVANTLAALAGAALAPTAGPVEFGWKLKAGAAGTRRVYAQFRDAAMPSNCLAARRTKRTESINSRICTTMVTLYR